MKEFKIKHIYLINDKNLNILDYKDSHLNSHHKICLSIIRTGNNAELFKWIINNTRVINICDILDDSKYEKPFEWIVNNKELFSKYDKIIFLPLPILYPESSFPATIPEYYRDKFIDFITTNVLFPGSTFHVVPTYKYYPLKLKGRYISWESYNIKDLWGDLSIQNLSDEIINSMEVLISNSDYYMSIKNKNKNNNLNMNINKNNSALIINKSDLKLYLAI